MFNKYRLNFVFLLFSVFLVVIFINLFALQVLDNEENAEQIENQNFEVFYIPAARGEIFDINGNKLASSNLEPYSLCFALPTSSIFLCWNLLTAES